VMTPSWMQEQVAMASTVQSYDAFVSQVARSLPIQCFANLESELLKKAILCWPSQRVQSRRKLSTQQLSEFLQQNALTS